MLKGVNFKMKKTFLIVLLVMMIVLAISVVSFAEDITLRIAWWGSQNRNNITLGVIKLFEEKYPNVKIQPEYLGWDEYWQKMSVETAGKNLPDAFAQDSEYIYQYVENDLLLNLDPYVEDNRLDLTSNLTTSEEGIFLGRINGKLYGVCLGINTQTGYIYDPELFKQAGVEEPTPDWTWEDYTEKCRKIHTALGIYGDSAYWGDKNINCLGLYLIQHGKTLYDKSGKKLGYEDDSLFADFYTIFANLVKEGVNAPPEVNSEAASLEDYLITKKKAAMQPCTANEVFPITAGAGRPLSMTIFPNAKDQVQYGSIITPASFFSVAKNSKYPEWAVKFIDFFINNLEANKILLAERGVPTSSKIKEGIKPYLGDVQKVMFDYMDVVMKHSSKVIIVYPPAHNQVKDLLSTITDKILYGELTPEKAAKEFREGANKILAEN
jgi:multiple sugar transport system substrate-binding protein